MLKLDEIIDRKFQIDIVILCTGRSQRAEWTDIDPTVDEECFRINAIAPTHLARCVLKLVRDCLVETLLFDRQMYLFRHRELHPTLAKLDHVQVNFFM